METEWATNVFEQGFLNEGPTLAARNLDYPGEQIWVTNVVQFGLVAAMRYFAFPQVWAFVPGWWAANGHFPYGLNV